MFVIRMKYSTLLKYFYGTVITSGIKPPCRKAKSARQAINEPRVLRANCEAETTEKSTIWVGIHRSGPSHLANS